MALQTERSNVAEVALAASLDYGHDVIGIPETQPREAIQTPFTQSFRSHRSAQPPQPPEDAHRVGLALSTVAFIAMKYLLAQVARVGPEFPFVDTSRRAEARPTRWNFSGTISAEPPAIRSFRKIFQPSPLFLFFLCSFGANISR